MLGASGNQIHRRRKSPVDTHACRSDVTANRRLARPKGQRSQRGEMLRRPKVGDTESDLLALQERFLVSGEKPSVSLAAESVGGKRKQRPDERDVVQLGGMIVFSPSIHISLKYIFSRTDLPPAVGKGVPTTKRSKFKQKQDHNVCELPRKYCLPLVCMTRYRPLLERIPMGLWMVSLFVWLWSRG